MQNFVLYIPVGVIWFIVFWIVGGVIFSIVALFRIAKLRKAQFSCLFTISCALCAIGATYSASVLGSNQIQACTNTAHDMFARFASVIACGIFPITLMGIVWFVGLMFVGTILLYISRSKNQSWVDKKLDTVIIDTVACTGEIHIH